MSRKIPPKPRSKAQTQPRPKPAPNQPSKPRLLIASAGLGLGFMLTGCGDFVDAAADALDQGQRALTERAPAGAPGELTGIWELREVRTNHGVLTGQGAVGEVLLLITSADEEGPAHLTMWRYCRPEQDPGEIGVLAGSNIAIEVEESSSEMRNESGQLTTPAESSGRLTVDNRDSARFQDCEVSLKVGEWQFRIEGRSLVIDDGTATQIWQKVGPESDIVPYSREAQL